MTTVERPAPAEFLVPDVYGLVTLIDHRPGHGGSFGMCGFSSRTAWCPCPRRRVPPSEVPAAPRSDVRRHDHQRYPFTTGNYATESSGHGPVLTCRCPATRKPTVPADVTQLADAHAVARELVAAVLAGDGPKVAALAGATSVGRVEVAEAVDRLMRLLRAEADAVMGLPGEHLERARRRWVALLASRPTDVY